LESGQCPSSLVYFIKVFSKNNEDKIFWCSKLEKNVQTSNNVLVPLHLLQYKILFITCMIFCALLMAVSVESPFPSQRLRTQSCGIKHVSYSLLYLLLSPFGGYLTPYLKLPPYFWWSSVVFEKEKVG